MLDNVEIVEKFEFEVINYDSVSLKKLCNQLTEKLSSVPALPNTVAVAIELTYALNGPAWRYKKFVKPAWHLAIPNAIVALDAANDAIARSGYCKQEQVVAANVVKYPSGDNTNRLRVILTVLSPPLKVDKPRFEAKFLEWYINMCQEKAKEPSYTEFNRNLKKIKEKRKLENEETKNGLESFIKNFAGNDSNQFK